jgi:hypothetical protein
MIWTSESTGVLVYTIVGMFLVLSWMCSGLSPHRRAAKMSAFKVVATIIGLASIAAFVAKPVGVRSEVTAEVAPITVKEDRSEMFSSGDGWACAQEPWPYGCQWRTPSKRVIIRALRPV